MKDGGIDGLVEAHRPSALETVAAVAAGPSPKPHLPAPHLPIAPPPKTMDKKTAQWNTKNLGWRLAADAISAASAAVLVAPVISIIDRSIMENASGRRTLATSLRHSFQSLLLRPHHLIISKPFALIFALYGGTYLTANAVDTITSTTKSLPPSHTTSGSAKFFASSASNIGLCIYKDQVFARLFGPSSSSSVRPVTLPTYLLFALRDCMTIFASFNLPPLLGPELTRRLGTETQKYASGQTLAQFAAPAAVQLFSTPVHLLGLDVYNRPFDRSLAKPTLRDRWAAVRKNWAVSTAARVCRIIPAFGVGGVVNVKVRKGLMDRLA